MDDQQEAEVSWYLKNGAYPERMRLDSGGFKYVIGDYSWNLKHPNKREYVEGLMPIMEMPTVKHNKSSAAMTDREAFARHVLTNHREYSMLPLDYLNDRYRADSIQIAWELWQAACKYKDGHQVEQKD